MSLEQFVAIETLKIELQELFTERRNYIADIKVSCGRTSAQMKLCLRMTLAMIEETKTRIQDLENELKQK